MARVDDARDLKLALDRRQFVVRYQPLIALDTGLLAGAEALVRWAHPTRGLVEPVDFLPVAEEEGLIVDVGYLVLEEACNLLSRWRDAGLQRLSVSVNLSLRQLTDTHLKANIAQILQTHSVDPRLLVLDVSADLVDIDGSLNGILAGLRALGLSLALDDFGVGQSRYAPRNALRRLPVDMVKIDPSVIAELGKSDAGRELTETAVEFTRKRALIAVAEGVESTQQLDLLREMHCDQAQGALLGGPQSAAAVTALAAERWQEQAAPPSN